MCVIQSIAKPIENNPIHIQLWNVSVLYDLCILWGYNLESTRKEIDDIIPEWYRYPTLVLGCGNYLLGDDGFGPAVVQELLEVEIELDQTYIMDVGSGAREIIFPMLIGSTRVERLVIIDAVDLSSRGRVPGEIFTMHIDDIPSLKVDDFSMHQIPTSNMLKDLRDKGNIDVLLLVCQIESIPDMVNPGLSKPVREAIPSMVRTVLNLLKSPKANIRNEHATHPVNQLDVSE